MAADAASAAVPGPADPPDSLAPDAPSSGMFASMLAPVAPARPTFDLTPTTASNDTTTTSAAGGSSASFHTDNGTTQTENSAGVPLQKQGIWRAWLLAGATRWGKGGGAQNKRLELAKAKAQSRQVKEAHQVTINRSDGLPSKSLNNPGAGGRGGKSLDSKTVPNKAPEKLPKNTKNSSGDSPRGSSGRTNGSAGTGGASGSQGPSGARGDAGERTPKPLKGEKGDTSRTSAGPGKSGGPGRTGATGKSNGGSPAPKNTKNDPAKDSAKNEPKPKEPRSTRTIDQPGSTNDKTLGAKGGTGAPGKPGAPTPGAGTNTGLLDKNKASNQPPQTNDQQTAKQPFSTRESRETGYRDGTRAAKAAAHLKAYRDGVKDGWNDTTEEADREKADLDKAHEQHKKTEKQKKTPDQDQEQPVPQPASSADYHQPPAKPIEVRGITATDVLLGDGADKNSMTRGEVRSLKNFERRLKVKAASMTRIAEATKALTIHAENQARQAARWAEDGKTVKGGEKLAATLAKLADAAKSQASKAVEIHKRAVRAAEGCRVLLTNAETRYGGIYKAVVDSDETTPAELAFYKQ